MRILLVFALFFYLANAGYSQEVHIQSPENDIIVQDAMITVSGVVVGTPGPGATVVLSMEGSPTTYSGAVGADGSWSIASVAIPANSTANWTAKLGTSTHTIVLTRGTGLASKGHQKVYFDWGQGVDAQILSLANGSLDTALTQDQQVAFVQGVRSQVVLAFTRAYSGYGIDIVNAPGAGIHTIQMMKDSSSLFGQSPYDFGNQDPDQQSQIFVGTFAASMTSDDWSPLAKTDSWRLRIIDAGEAIGRSCAHELGHSLGLVGSDAFAPGGWMRGCDGGHNCDQVQAQFPLSARFKSGQFIMDPGEKSLPNNRVAEPSQSARSATRRPAGFNPFNRSYLSFVHP
jgi:hypothetical protein